MQKDRAENLLKTLLNAWSMKDNKLWCDDIDGVHVSNEI